jgi:putative hydrolase of the HAD superfamily
MSNFVHVDTWLFDMDDTLYDATAHIFPHMKTLMMNYVAEHFGLSPAAAAEARQRMLKAHGTTLRGLMIEHGADPEHFLAATHDIDVAHIPFCAVTAEKIAQLPGRKIVYTNSHLPFAEKVLARIGILPLLDGIHAINDAHYLPKNMPESCAGLIERFKIDPQRACFFDDSSENLLPCKNAGMTTVWICGDGEESANIPHVDHRTATLKEWLEFNVT